MSRSMLLLLPLLVGCYTTKVYVGEPGEPAGRVEHEWQQTFFWGLVSVGRVNASEVCGEAGVQMVKSQIGGIGLVANWLTAGIWAPMHVKVTCGPKPGGA